VLQVSDFGVARSMQQQRTHRTTATRGTFSHLAPELLQLGRLSSAADVYAFGMTSEWAGVRWDVQQ
jgi:serine/threonine protein kinase